MNNIINSILISLFIFIFGVGWDLIMESRFHFLKDKFYLMIIVWAIIAIMAFLVSLNLGKAGGRFR